MSSETQIALTPELIAELLGRPTIQARRWQAGTAEMRLTPVETLKLCRGANITLQQLAAIYSDWAC